MEPIGVQFVPQMLSYRSVHSLPETIYTPAPFSPSDSRTYELLALCFAFDDSCVLFVQLVDWR